MNVGIRGCCGQTKRKGKLRYCAQKAVFFLKNSGWCFYHNPNNPHKFGERKQKEAIDEKNN